MHDLPAGQEPAAFHCLSRQWTYIAISESACDRACGMQGFTHPLAMISTVTGISAIVLDLDVGISGIVAIYADDRWNE